MKRLTSLLLVLLAGGAVLAQGFPSNRFSALLFPVDPSASVPYRIDLELSADGSALGVQVEPGLVPGLRSAQLLVDGTVVAEFAGSRTVSAADLRGPLTGQELSSLTALLAGGSATLEATCAAPGDDEAATPDSARRYRGSIAPAN